MKTPRRYPAFISVLLIISLLPRIDAPLEAAGVTYSRLSDIAFQPQDSDGYIQAWNVNFRGGGYAIFMTYLISNIGPGSWNNGVSVVIRFRGRTRVGTAEFSKKSLLARRGQVNLKFGKKNSLVYSGGRYIATAGIRSTSVKLVIRPWGRGIRISGGRMRVTGDASRFIRADIPVTSAYVTGTLKISGRTIKLRGIGGLEHILTNHSPHKYAKRFVLTRTFTAHKGLFIGGFYGNSSFPNNRYVTAVYTERGRIVKSGIVQSVRVIKQNKNSFSGYYIPQESEYIVAGADSCRISQHRSTYMGGFYVLANVSMFLRGILRLFFAKPYVLHYWTRITLTCAHKPGTTGGGPFQERLYGLSSYYLIND